MTSYIRRLVSGPKARFKDPELNLELDLVYITPQIIIMGYPADGFESLYRNKRADAKRFLDTRHGKNYWVFNLCPLRENGYEKSVFEGRVTRFPFPDHHAPPLAILPLVTREMHAWLDGSPDRVAVIHCKAGKGRSGTIACSYLLTLAASDSPAPPAGNEVELHFNKDGHKTAKSQTQTALDQIPENLDSGAPPPKHKDALSKRDGEDLAELLETSPLFPESTARPNIDPQATASNAAPVNKEKGFVDALKGVLDLHTAQRMKPPGEPKKKKKQKQGVSIPSQRRYLYYWALILNGEAPKDVFDIYAPPPPKPISTRAKPLVRITQIRVRMREPSGVKLGLVRAANVVLDKAVEYRKKSKGSPKVEVEGENEGESGATKTKTDGGDAEEEEDTRAFTGANKLWASIARYDDGLVDFLEGWEAKTRAQGKEGKEEAKEGKGEQGDWAEMDDELKALFDEHGKWDKEKMVRSFARFGLKAADEVQEYVLKLAADNRVHGHARKPSAPALKESGKDDALLQPSSASLGKKHGLHGEGGDTDSFYASSISSTGGAGGLSPIPESTVRPTTTDRGAVHTPTPVERLQAAENGAGGGLVVEACREVRVKLYVGQVFIGWTWFVPTFHMPQPPSAGNDTARASTLHLKRKELDFPLGLGTAIVSVDVDMEWVASSAALPSLTTASPPSAVTSGAFAGAATTAETPLGTVSGGVLGTSVDSDAKGQGGVGAAVVQAVNAMHGGGGEGTGGGVAEGGVREAVEVGQSKGV
ncbi:ptenb protein [Ephemerocybe angulata]|uniref:phosphatidylinositol-3,4,5-trisphosphate 3-phosphatase n=1 Tax=Ephemerocybe angulata TaxID=980116 RepID=A0A8H6HIY4_9AGAR|nr:ptenb protein [Tulosesus angulatus]